MVASGQGTVVPDGHQVVRGSLPTSGTQALGDPGQMTAPLRASAFSSPLRARRHSRSGGSASSSSFTPTPPPWGEVPVGGSPGGAAETACPPPPGWAMSNQLHGQGALWTERDKRPCVHDGLLIYRPPPPTLRSGRPGPHRRDGAAPGAPSPLAPWRLGAQPGSASGPGTPGASAGQLPAQGAGSPGSSASPVLAPARPIP